jgi:hypothetical protein
MDAYDFSSYWISPKGQIIEIEDHPVKRMVEDPSLFGYTYDQLHIIYIKYSDVNEMKGEATKVVIQDMIYKGWSYCHRRNSAGDWYTSVLKLDKITRFNLQLWAKEMIIRGAADKNDPLKIYRHLRDLKLKKTFDEVSEGEFF